MVTPNHRMQPMHQPVIKFACANEPPPSPAAQLNCRHPMSRAIIFDLYETLVTEFDPNWTPAAPSIAERIGVSEDAMSRGWERVRDAHMRGVVNFQEALTAIARFSGRRRVPSDVLTSLDEERRAEKARPFETVDEQVFNMVEILKQTDWRLCVMSNASAEETWAWNACRLQPLFDAVVFSYEVGYLKPEREIYELGCNLVGTNVADALFIGDGGADELRGAAAFGLEAHRATWFLDRWPARVRDGYTENAVKFPQLHHPRLVCQLACDRRAKE